MVSSRTLDRWNALQLPVKRGCDWFAGCPSSTTRDNRATKNILLTILIPLFLHPQNFPECIVGCTSERKCQRPRHSKKATHQNLDTYYDGVARPCRPVVALKRSQNLRADCEAYEPPTITLQLATAFFVGDQEDLVIASYVLHFVSVGQEEQKNQPVWNGA